MPRPEGVSKWQGSTAKPPRAGRSVALQALWAELDRLAEAGWMPPCAGEDRRLWISGDRDERAAAVRVCRESCLVRRECGAAGRKEPAGVWGGHDHESREWVVRRARIMRGKGRTWRAIGDRLGVDHTTIFRWCQS